MNALKYKRIQGLVVALIGVGLDAYVGTPTDEQTMAVIADHVATVFQLAGVAWNLIGQTVARGPIKLGTGAGTLGLS